MIVYFWIIWWWYYIYCIFLLALSPKQVQTKNNWIFEYVLMHSVPFYVSRAIFSVMHVLIIVLSCWLLHVYPWFEYKFYDWIYILCMCSMYGGWKRSEWAQFNILYGMNLIVLINCFHLTGTCLSLLEKIQMGLCLINKNNIFFL